MFETILEDVIDTLRAIVFVGAYVPNTVGDALIVLEEVVESDGDDDALCVFESVREVVNVVLFVDDFEFPSEKEDDCVGTDVLEAVGLDVGSRVCFCVEEVDELTDGDLLTELDPDRVLLCVDVFEFIVVVDTLGEIRIDFE